jgi:hypothetical protein
VRTLAYALALALAACGHSSENAGRACASADQCYPLIDGTQLHGDVQCLTQVQDGYCTHLCTADNDCCAVAGECETNHPEVCSPFESTGMQYCFLSCEDADVTTAGLTDANVYCQRFASRVFTCRSTGGGALNRKVCAP